MVLWQLTGSVAGSQGITQALFPLVFLAFSTVGALIVSRQPENRIGWILLGAALAVLAGVSAGRYAMYALLVAPNRLPAGAGAAWLASLVVFFALIIFTFLPLLFPDGRLPSRRWRPVAWLAVGGLALLIVGTAFTPGPLESLPAIDNPVGLAGTPGQIMPMLVGSGLIMLVVSMLASATSLVIRFRRSRGAERQQIKWLASAAGLIVALFPIQVLLHYSGLDEPWMEGVWVVAFLGVPVAIGTAVFKYRLYDIDVVISRTIVCGGLAAFITAVYVSLLVGVGSLIGMSTGSNIGLAIVATALVAVAFQPIRERVERLARRLVFGRPSAAEVRAGVAIQSLGAFRVFRGGQPISPTTWQSKKARTLLKILLARHGRATTRDFLMEALWPEEDPGIAARRLSVALATVRSVLDPQKRHPPEHFITGDRDAIRLDLGHIRVDVEDFLLMASRGLVLYREGHVEEAKPVLEAAQIAYAGDFLEENPYEDWSASLREEAGAAYVSVTRALAEIATDSGEHDAAVQQYVRILERDGWDEGAHLGLILTLERAGRRGEARRRYRAYAEQMSGIQAPAVPFPLIDRSDRRPLDNRARST